MALSTQKRTQKKTSATAVGTRRPLLYCQPRAAVTSCPVNKVIMDLEFDRSLVY